MRRLTFVAITTTETIGQCELFTVYFDCILALLFPDPDRRILLCWSNVLSDENDKIRPDATISKLWQCDLGSSFGYGEVKIACHTVDNNAPSVLIFQVHGVYITFFLTRLRHDGIYNMRTLMTVSDTFWRLCRPVHDAHLLQEKKRRLTHPSIYSLIDSTKNFRRFCALRFE
ncbi:hypothetical protein CLU79DRAFT_801770 [Phycomyces nitens]|nr:hypothetical protein CLU79DRAFT_801770 [Phycomyces nitens]